MTRTILVAAALLCALTINADARQRHRTAPCVETGTLMQPVCGTAQAGSGLLGNVPAGAKIRVTMHRERVGKAPKALSRRVQALSSYGIPTTSWADTTVYSQAQAHVAAQIVGGRPAGCPSRFCGCGASLHLFGRIIPSLNLAANWLRFPRAAPAPKMAAARPGHVFVLEQHISGDTWLVFDANSGGHRTRLHARSIAGYQIVNPHGAG